MASKAQRKKERHAKRRKEKRKQQRQQGQSRSRNDFIDRRLDFVAGSNELHRQRLAQQSPQAWPEETPEDTAIFQDTALPLLSPELVEQVSAVREALQEALESRGDEALRRVSAIPRTSPFSEWRLFIRGLIDWLADNPAAAGEAWHRLDPERRPGRIASVMMLSLRTDLDQAAPLRFFGPEESAGNQPHETRWSYCDEQQLDHARLLRQVRFDRAALRVAEIGVNIPEESKELHLGFRKIHWVKRFIREYGETEPELAAALAETALGRAFAQDYSNIFDDAVACIRGPRHDPHNLLLTFQYHIRFGGQPAAQRRAEKALHRYLTIDLPGNEALSAPLRGAIASQLHLNEAVALIEPRGDGSLFDQEFTSREDLQSIRDHLRSAVKAAPNNAPAYRTWVKWIQSQLDDDRLHKSQQSVLEDELTEVMRSWSQGVPSEVEPRLWLVDYLLENEQLDEARPHVDFLATVRHENPLARATPWKWQILEAMRLCRRKAWLGEVPARLNEAETLWPTWLPKQWLPYLRAALTLRSGRKDEFEDQRRRITEETGRVRDSLADACMMLAAAQQMRVNSSELKPFRKAVDAAVGKGTALPMDDVLDATGFFWDLHRVKLLYSAYQSHTKAIGKILIAHLYLSQKRVLEEFHQERIQKAVLWGSEHRFWPVRNERTVPAFFNQEAVRRHPIVVAATVNALLKERRHWGIEKYGRCASTLREAAGSQRDPWYRYWFAELASQLDEAVNRETSRFSGFPFGNIFGGLFGDDSDDSADDPDDDDDDLGFDSDSECDCPACRAARKASEQAKASKDRS